MMKRFVRAAILLIGGSAAVVMAQQAPPLSQAPEPPPLTFRVEVNYVEVDAVVTDADGRVVTDLTQQDFEIREDGRAQQIATFARVNLPIELPAKPLFANSPIEPDVRVNTMTEGRVYMIVLDELHTTFSNTPRVRRFLREFIERNFGVNDLAAVVFTGGPASRGQDFTNSRRMLLEAIDKFSGQRLRSDILETLEAREFREPLDTGNDPQGFSRRSLDPYEQERAFHARSMLTSIKDLSAFMEGIRGRRKSMLLISEGITYDVADVFSNRSAGMVLDHASEAVAAATRANVAIYAIDPRGLSGFDDAIEVGGVPPAGGSSSHAPPLLSQMNSALRVMQESLRVLAEGTGGFAAVNSNDFSGVFDRIVRENSTYYMLGYYPTNDRRDGRFRRIDVRVKRPGLQVRARRGYIAPRGRATRPGTAAGAEGAIRAALASPIPLAGIPLSMAATPYKGPAPNASIAVAVEMRADSFTFKPENGAFLDRLGVAFTPIDTAGKRREGKSHVLGLKMSPQNVADTRARGLRVIGELSLPPGRYQIRAAVAEEGGDRSGSVLYDLEVPDFHKTGVSMSGIALASAASVATPTVVAAKPSLEGLPVLPTSAREFVRNDILALFAEFYENAPQAASHTIDLSATVRSEDGRVVFENREQRSSTDLQGKSGGYGYTVEIPLKEFTPGLYVIHVEGRSRAGNVGIGRDVLIRVR